MGMGSHRSLLNNTEQSKTINPVPQTVLPHQMKHSKVSAVFAQKLAEPNSLSSSVTSHDLGMKRAPQIYEGRLKVE